MLYNKCAGRNNSVEHILNIVKRFNFFFVQCIGGRTINFGSSIKSYQNKNANINGIRDLNQ